MSLLSMQIQKELAGNRRVFAGLDFPFGYPTGAAKLVTGEPRWDALWRRLQDDIDDNDLNQSNRYALAAAWNRNFFPAPFYWGHPHQHEYKGLPAKKPSSAAFRKIERRLVEQRQPSAKSVWQLAYNGAAGSQAMLGMARLQKLRRELGAKAAIWPFETNWAKKLSAPVVIAEIYPSLFEPQYKPGDVKDAAQVRTVAKVFAQLDAQGAFKALLSRPDGLSVADAASVLREEGWIVGAGNFISPK